MFLLVLLPLLKLVDAQGCASLTGSCPDLCTSDVPNFAAYSQYPIFLTFATGSQYANVDSICLTVDCLPDGSNSYVLYETFTYGDGSTSITTNVVDVLTSGINILSSASSYQYQYNLGQSSCGYVKYACIDCGLDTESFGFGDSNRYGKISDACLSQSLSVLQAQNISTDVVTVFPMERGPNCYYSSCTSCSKSASPCPSPYPPCFAVA